ncbi:MAG: DUF262 domain-containing protein [Burkholderiales bacterium]|nr:MAG: DUF262 domain-containing protein [Burkholderiales bacterium]
MALASTGMPRRLPDVLLSGAAAPRTIASLWEESAVEMTLAGERQLMSLVLPPWQRPSVWDAQRQRAFIEGILLGFPPGAIVTVEPDWTSGPGGHAVVKKGSGWLIDGQQRVTAIREFVEGPLTVFDGLGYRDLARAEQLRRFDRVVLTRICLPNDTDEQTLKALYRRMNYGGVAHTQEDLARLGDAADGAEGSR